MAIQYSTALRNNQLDQIEATVGIAARLQIYSGTVPATCLLPPSGTLLVDMSLPADWMNPASNGSKTLLGMWSGAGTAAAGTGTTAGYFRIYDSTASTCHVQGTITHTSGLGDLKLDNVSIANGQGVTIPSFTISAANG